MPDYQYLPLPDPAHGLNHHYYANEPASNSLSVNQSAESALTDDLEITVKRPSIKLSDLATPSDVTDDDGTLADEPEKLVSPYQEKAQQYLKRKQLRHELHRSHLSPSIPSSPPWQPETDQYPVFIRTTTTGLAQQSGLRASSRLKNASQLRSQRHRKIFLRHLARKNWRHIRDKDQQNFRRFWTLIISSSISIFLIFTSLIGGGSYLAYRFFIDTQNQYNHQVTTLLDLMPQDNLKMYDSSGILMGQMQDQGIHTTVTYPQISQNLIDATISTEDKDFWSNQGVDLMRILQSALQNLSHGHIVAGGSTITQQLIKNLVLQNQKQDITRKLQEIVLTPDVNNHYSKKEILNMYLNSNYYGEQAYGVDAAASVYFGLEDQPDKPAASQLDLAQAAMLAGLPSAPNGYDPWLHHEAAMDRTAIVLDLMHKNGYITQNQADAALTEAQSPDFLKHPVSLKNRAPHFYDFVIEQLKKQFPRLKDHLSLSGMKVYTTVDVNLQDKVQQIMQNQINSLANHNVTNASAVLIDYHTGAIRTLLGSVDYNSTSIDGKFDVATEGYRQPGSSFKPYVYVTAFEQGTSPGQAINDEPISIPQGKGQPPFVPHNYFGNFSGHMTIRCALQNSLNIPAVKVLQHAGIDATMQTVKDMGITDYKGDLGYAVALGSLNVHLLDHTSAFGTFANGGVHVPYYVIEKVEFTNTHQVYGHAANPGKQAISPQLAYMMTDVLGDNEARSNEFGFCNPLNLRTDGSCYGPLLPSAAKTGTTNDFRDSWTLGYTSDFVLGVWTGNNDNSQMINVNGIMGAAPIWHDAMLVAEQGHNPQAFKNPGGLIKMDQTYNDGVHTNDWYLADKLPTPKAKPTPTATPTNDNNKNNDDQKNNDDHKNDPKPATSKPMCSCYNYDFQPPDNKDAQDKDWW